jgi:hypothetical protein
MQNNVMSFYIYFKESEKKLAWRYYQMVKDIPFFMFCYKFYFII